MWGKDLTKNKGVRLAAFPGLLSLLGIFPIRANLIPIAYKV